MRPQLTAREYEVVRLRAEGFSNDEVGVKLGRSTQRTKGYITNALRKADVHTFVELLSALGWLIVPDQDVSIAEVRHERLLSA